jgi:hypothetical protein
MESVNPNGTSANLVASHPGNTNAAKSGVYSRTGRILAPRAAEIAETIQSAPHVKGLDSIAAEEIGSLVALSEAIDRDLIANGITRRGEARTLVKLKIQISRRIQEWCDRFAMTPRARAELLRDLGATSVAVEYARRRGERDAAGD